MQSYLMIFAEFHLLFSGYNIPKKIISEQVRNLDIFPTIFDLIGLDNKLNTSNQSLSTFNARKSS